MTTKQKAAIGGGALAVGLAASSLLFVAPPRPPKGPPIPQPTKLVIWFPYNTQELAETKFTIIRTKKIIPPQWEVYTNITGTNVFAVSLKEAESYFYSIDEVYKTYYPTAANTNRIPGTTLKWNRKP